MRKLVLPGGESVEYELSRKRVKNINLRIGADGRIAVSAPRAVPLTYIEAFMRSNEDKILKVLREAALRAPAPEYCEGDSVPVLGRGYSLRVAKGGKNRAEIKGEELWLYVKDPEDAALRKKTAEAFYKSLCAEYMPRICAGLLPGFSAYLAEMPEIRYRRMKSRWGSCTPKKKSVCFNSLLAMSPIECMEFVAAHEFCHFIHADHSSSFYASLAAVMPDWKVRKEKLKAYSALIK